MKFNPPDLSGVKRLVVDTETTGVNWKKDKVVGYVLATDDFSGYYPVGHSGGGNLPREAVERWIRKVVSDPNLKIINHAMKFDLHMMANHDIRPAGPVECTMVNSALLNENQGAFNLDVVSKLYPIPHKKGADLYAYMAEKFGGGPDRKQMANFHKLRGDDPKATEYAVGDGSAVAGVWAHQQKQLDAEGLRPVWEVECKVTRVLFEMERRGVRVDEQKLLEVKKFLEGGLRAAQKKLPKNFNVRSAKQIAGFMSSNKVKGWPVTEKGNDSFTEKWLSTNPVGQLIVTVRKLTNLLNSFIDPLIKDHLHNGRVHTTFNQLRQDEYGVVTGRLSSSEPNMQQVPKRDGVLAPLFRQIFLPEKGHQWSSNDYSQQEFRVFADYTGSPLLIKGYKAKPPMDIHSAVAHLLKVDRDPTAKRINLGLVYGMGSAKLAKSLGVPEEEAKRLMGEYHSMIPEARAFLREAEAWAKRRGWVRTKLFRRRRFPDARLAHKAGNSIIQGTSADMTKLKMVEIYEWFRGNNAESALMLQVHDELDWSLAPEEKALGEGAREIMEDFGPIAKIHFQVPMTVDHHEAAHWGAASFPKYNYGG